jgi:Transposase IS116/IS110/IS902 family
MPPLAVTKHALSMVQVRPKDQAVSVASSVELAAEVRMAIGRCARLEGRSSSSSSGSSCSRGIGSNLPLPTMVGRLIALPNTLSPPVRASIDATLAFLREEIAKMQRQVQELVERSAELRGQQLLLCSIPGVGSWTAARVLAEIDEVRTAVDARQRAAYAGLTPVSGPQAARSTVHRGWPRRAIVAYAAHSTCRPSWRCVTLRRCAPLLSVCVPVANGPW